MPLIINNMKKLNAIAIFERSIETSFVFPLLQNSQETLKRLNVSKFSIPDIVFPKLTTIAMRIGEDDTSVFEVQTYFPKVLKNVEFLENVNLYLHYEGTLSVCQYICKNYQKHCIMADYDAVQQESHLQDVPFKILIGADLTNLENMNYLSHLQYIHFYIRDEDDPMSDGWDRYQEVFDQCTNLKAIELIDCDGDNFTTEFLPILYDNHQTIWKQRLAYFQKRGIRIASLNEIRYHTREKLVKELGLTWSIYFEYIKPSQNAHQI